MRLSLKIFDGWCTTAQNQAGVRKHHRLYANLKSKRDRHFLYINHQTAQENITALISGYLPSLLAEVQGPVAFDEDSCKGFRGLYFAVLT